MYGLELYGLYNCVKTLTFFSLATLHPNFFHLLVNVFALLVFYTGT